MNQRIIAQIGKSQRLEIINQLKRTSGLSVKELGTGLGMSYMGVKQHCIELQKEGYLDTWRRPQALGRPEMVYRLTKRAHELFPVGSNLLTIELLESAKKLYGPASAEKLLFTIYQGKAADYLARIKGDNVAQKAKWLTRLRDHEGYMAELESKEDLRIVEHHSPVLDLLRAFPIIERLETELFQRVLNIAVHREENTVSGLYYCTFRIGQAAG